MPVASPQGLPPGIDAWRQVLPHGRHEAHVLATWREEGVGGRGSDEKGGAMPPREVGAQGANETQWGEGRAACACAPLG